MSYKFESKVTKALGELLETGKIYDAIINISEKPDFKEFLYFYPVNPFILMKILAAKDVEKKDGKFVIKKPDFRCYVVII